MALKRPNFNQDIIESATDPTIGGLYTITAGSIWLDISGSPAILKERNSSNTAWVATGASGPSGVVTVTIASKADTWTGTTTVPGLLTTSEVLLTVNAAGLQTSTVFLPNVTAVNNGSFSWWVGAFKNLSSGTFFIHYTAVI